MEEDEKKVFLKEQSDKYEKDINEANPFPKKKKKIHKVKFDLKRNNTHYFDKHSKVAFMNKKEGKKEQNSKAKEVNKDSNSNDKS